MAENDIQPSLPARTHRNRDLPEGCCMRDVLFGYRSETNLQKADKSTRKRKMTLVTSESSQNEKHISMVPKQKRRSMTSIMQPDLPRGSSWLRLSSNTNTNPESQTRGSHVQSQTLKPKPIIQLISKPNIYNNIKIEFPTVQSQVLTCNSTNHGSKAKPSLNAIKASKINVNPFTISRPSSVIQVSQQPISRRERFFDDKSIGSTQNISQSPSVLIKSLAEPATDRKICSITNIANDQLDRSQDKYSIISDLGGLQSPLLHKSVISYNENPSFTENNTSEVLFRIPVMGFSVELEPEDLRRGESFTKKTSKPKRKGSDGRTMTFAEEGLSDDASGQDRLSLILKSFKKLAHFEQYFNRGGFIGAGRVSTVYRVQQNATKFIAASKQVFKKIAYEKDTAEEIIREISQHYRLPLHKNIVTLYGTFEDAGRYYFISELCQANLRSLMKEKLLEQTALNYLKDILQGLTVLHRHKIVHKHLKPQNILVSLGVCKIGDFGWSSKLLQMSNHYPSYQYSAPEVSNKQDKITVMADCWSLGIIAFEMVVGELPMPCEEDIVEKNKESMKGMSKKYRDLVQGLLQIDPKGRYTAAKALEVIQSQPIQKLTLEQIQQLIS